MEPSQVEDALAYVEIMRRDAIRLDAMLFDVLSLEGLWLQAVRLTYYDHGFLLLPVRA